MKKSGKKLIKYIIIIGILSAIIFFVNKHNILKDYGPNEIKEYILSFGIWAPIVYLILLTLLPLLLFPDSILVIAGGMIFGLWGGSILTTIGSFFGATIAFYISRLLGQQVVKKFIKKDLVLLKEESMKSGFFIILMLRLIPLFPFKVVSYSAGLSDIKYKDFAFATILGSLPGIIVYTNVGDKSTAVGSTGFYISLGLLVLLLVVSLLLKKRFSTKDIGGDKSEDA